MRREILGFLKMNDVEYREGVSLATLSTVKIGANADFVVYPDTVEKLLKLVCFLDDCSIKHKILGRISNALPPDERYDGVIVKTDRLSGVQIEGTTVAVDVGMSLPSLARRTAQAELSGLEELSGIPGSVGGALINNAGAFGREISDLVKTVSAYNKNSGQIVELKPWDLAFGYRTSLFKNGEYIILGATITLSYADREDIFRKMQKYAQKRRETQPTDKPSLGSTFKRPAESIYPWRLIDECGLRGYRIGGASISTKHAGFIVNDGDASANDYLSLALYVEKCVYDRFKIRLEREIEVL